MQKTLCIIALLFGAYMAPNANADTLYTLTFNATVGTAPSSATFDYNGTAFILPATVNWDSQSFNFLDNTLPDHGLNAPSKILTPSCVGSDTGAQATIDLLTNCGTVHYATASGNTPTSVYTFLIAPGPTSPLFSGVDVYEQIGTPSGCVPFGTCPASAGTVTVAISSTPEPSSGILLLSGIGLFGLAMRKRTALSLPQGA